MTINGPTRIITINDRHVTVPENATGRDIKWHAARQGIGVEAVDQLQGHNCNGSNQVIGDADVPWHHNFTAVSIFDNA